MIFRTLLFKDLKELLRTKKILVLPFIFTFFAIISPLSAKYTKEIISAMDPSLVNLIPEPVVTDSYLQLFKNWNQLGLMVLIFLVTSSFMDEKLKGTLTLLLAKPISRMKILMSKLAVNLLLLVSSIIIATVFFVFYTYVLFNEFDALNFIYSILFFTLFSLFLMIVSLFFSVIFKSYVSALVSIFSVYIGLSIINMLNVSVFQFLPTKLLDLSQNIMLGTVDSMDIVYSVIGTIVISIVLLGISFRHFRNQEF